MATAPPSSRTCGSSGGDPRGLRRHDHDWSLRQRRRWRHLTHRARRRLIDRRPRSDGEPSSARALAESLRSVDPADPLTRTPAMMVAAATLVGVSALICRTRRHLPGLRPLNRHHRRSTRSAGPAVNTTRPREAVAVSGNEIRAGGLTSSGPVATGTDLLWPIPTARVRMGWCCCDPRPVSCSSSPSGPRPGGRLGHSSDRVAPRCGRPGDLRPSPPRQRVGRSRGWAWTSGAMPTISAADSSCISGEVPSPGPGVPVPVSASDPRAPSSQEEP